MKHVLLDLCIVVIAAGCSQPGRSIPEVSSTAPEGPPVIQSQPAAPQEPAAFPGSQSPSAVSSTFPESRPGIPVEPLELNDGAAPSFAANGEPPSARTEPVPTNAESTPAKWESVLDHIDPERNAVAGQWSKTNDGLHVAASAGARLSIPISPSGEYDARITLTRHSGSHSVALFFPHGAGQAGFEVDAWGDHLGGIQNISGRTLTDNPTRQTGLALTNGRRYTMTIEVRTGEVRVWLDGRIIATHRTDGGDLSIPSLWTMPDRRSLGIGAWDSTTTFHTIEVRTLSDAPLQVAAAAPAVNQPPSRSERPIQETPPANSRTTPLSAQPVPVGGRAAGKRVLLVIANHHFFYREYAEPRAELERAGVRVTVAAGRKERCTPHGGSGEGADRGIVQPDITIAEARAADYDAILFSGGWGASAYQFAFDGRYDTPEYNGDRAVKAAVNRLIGDFLAQDKYVCALCNAVSVLAWARVDGRSPLNGKRVCAPTRQAASGIYNGRQAQPSCRWHPEANGAILSPAGSIGRPGTAEDDVLVDGRIVTGEDDISAREMGRRIVQLLSQ